MNACTIVEERRFQRRIKARKMNVGFSPRGGIPLSETGPFQQPINPPNEELKARDREVVPILAGTPSAATPTPAVTYGPKMGTFVPSQQIAPTPCFPHVENQAATPHQARHC